MQIAPDVYDRRSIVHVESPGSLETSKPIQDDCFRSSIQHFYVILRVRPFLSSFLLAFFLSRSSSVYFLHFINYLVIEIFSYDVN